MEEMINLGLISELLEAVEGDFRRIGEERGITKLIEIADKIKEAREKLMEVKL